MGFEIQQRVFLGSAGQKIFYKKTGIIQDNKDNLITIFFLIFVKVLITTSDICINNCILIYEFEMQETFNGM